MPALHGQRLAPGGSAGKCRHGAVRVRSGEGPGPVSGTDTRAVPRSSFESFKPRDPKQQRALSLTLGDPGGSWYLTGAYGNGKTHLLYAQYRELVTAGQVRCHVRTTRELVEELRRAEFDEDFVSPVIAAASRRAPYHLFWDDIDKLKLTEFKTEVLFDLVDSLYRQKHGLTVTGNYSMRDLVEHERMHPAIVRRLDDMCRALDL